MLISKLKTLAVCALALTFLSFAERPAAAAEPEFKLYLATIAPTGTPWAKILKRLRKRVQTESNGRIKVVIKWFGKLGSENTMVRRCAKGQVGGIGLSVGAVGNHVPELYALELPYLFDDNAHVDAAMKRATPLMKELMAAKGFILHLWGENGWRHLASKDRFFFKPSDLKGQKMRSQPAKPHVWMYQALGASFNEIATPDVLQSLANNVVSGYDNTLIFGYATQWYKEVKHITLSGHIYQPAVVAWCKPFVDKLPDDLKAVLLRVPAGEEKKGRDMVRHLNRMLKGKYEEQGVAVKALSGAQKAAFKKATSGVIDKFRKSTTAKGRELLQLLQGK